MKLSKRLQQVDRMIAKKYDHIWDCCCDHGLLGMNLLARDAGTVIHFVDVVEPLIDNLASQLLKYQADHVNQTMLKSKWQVHCLGAENIPLQRNTSNLIIIAGVGGDLLIEIVDAIVTKHPNQDFDFLLCPIHHNYKVRQALTRLGLGLVDEVLVTENKRFYEVIHASTESKRAISPVGSVMWDFSRQEDQECLKQTLAHYQRIQRTEDKCLLKFTQKVISDYHALNTSI
ncbi:MAG: tRNA (adenine22-N1)-methyltransferase [Pseudohongiellaceae bacterium]|jgi:tRNA (adenine22-N1)-methyltransferase